MTPTNLFEAIESLGISKDDDEFVSVASTMLLYILDVETAYECQASLKALVDFSKIDMSGQKFRLMVSGISYIHLNLKFFTLNIIKSRNSLADYNKYAKTFNITRNDVVLIRRVIQQAGVLRELKKHDIIVGIDKQKINGLAFLGVYDAFNRIHPAIMKHIRNKTYQKLRFISMSSNVELYDLNMDLMCKALQIYLKKVPTVLTDAEITRYICGALNNHAINIIKSYTTQKRKRMQQGTADGYGGFNYEITTLSENQMLRAFGIEGLNYENMQDTSINSSNEYIRDSNLSYQLVLKKFGTNNKRKTFIKLIALQEHKKFTAFLNLNSYIKDGQDNIDYHSRITQREYVEAVCLYLKVSLKSGVAFMNTIAKIAYPEQFVGGNHEYE